MKSGAAPAATATLTILLLLSACGDINATLPGGNSYRVEAGVGGASLKGDSSLLRLGDRVSLRFAVPPENDPDLTGVLVSFRDGRGETADPKIRFVPESGPVRAVESGELAIPVASFARAFPAFSVPEGLGIGGYVMVIEALGRRGPLRVTEIPVFYIADAEFSLADVSMSLPGLFASRPFPPGTRALIEAGLSFDERLDPYLVWSDAAGTVGRGRAREGAAGVIWELPAQTAFHALKVEIFPFPPSPDGGWLPGITREMSVPVSASARAPGFFFSAGPGREPRNALAEGTFRPDGANGVPPGDGADGNDGPPILLAWYRFDGNLDGAVSGGDGAPVLVPVGDGPPLWTSAGGSYGLSTFADRSFALSPVDFLRGEADSGGGVFLLHVRPVSDGLVFGALFPARSGVPRGAWLDLSLNGDSLFLRLGTSETTEETSVVLSASELRALVPAAVKFRIHPDRVEANLAVGEDGSARGDILTVRLSWPLTGEGMATLGGIPHGYWTREPGRTEGDSGGDSEAGENADSGAATETGKNAEGSATAIWNEFAVLLSSRPFARRVAGDSADSAPGAEFAGRDDGENSGLAVSADAGAGNLAAAL